MFRGWPIADLTYYNGYILLYYAEKMESNRQQPLEFSCAEFLWLLNSQITSPAPEFGAEYTGEDELSFFGTPITLDDLPGQCYTFNVYRPNYKTDFFGTLLVLLYTGLNKYLLYIAAPSTPVPSLVVGMTVSDKATLSPSTAERSLEGFQG